MPPIFANYLGLRGLRARRGFHSSRFFDSPASSISRVATTMPRAFAVGLMPEMLLGRRMFASGKTPGLFAAAYGVRRRSVAAPSAKAASVEPITTATSTTKVAPSGPACVARLSASKA